MRNGYLIIIVFCTLTGLSQEKLNIEFTEFFSSDNCPEFMLTKLALPIEDDTTIGSFEINDVNINYFISSQYWNYNSVFQKIKIDIHNNQQLSLYIDSNNDGEWNEDPFQGKMYDPLRIDLLYSYGDNNKYRIPCDIVVSKNGDDINMSAFLISKCVSDYKTSTVHQSISFFKYGSGINFVQVNGNNIPYGSPITLGDNQYKIFDFDYVTNILTLEKLNTANALYGVLEGFYVKEKELLNAMQFHNLDLSKKQYRIFYFWGHWCEPCTSSMGDTQSFLNGLSDEKFEIFNVNLSRLASDKDIVNSIIEKYDIRNNAHEYPTIGSSVHNEMPFINLFKNMSYPNFIVIDKNSKIVYSGFNNDVSIQEFIKGL